MKLHLKKSPYTKEQLHTVNMLRLQNKDVHQIAQHMGIPEFLVTKMTIKLMAQDKLKYEQNQFKQLDFNKVTIHKPHFKFNKIIFIKSIAIATIIIGSFVFVYPIIQGVLK